MHGPTPVPGRAKLTERRKLWKVVALTATRACAARARVIRQMWGVDQYEVAVVATAAANCVAVPARMLDGARGDL